MKTFTLIQVLPLLLLALHLADGQEARTTSSTVPFATTRCFSKGGLGIVNPNLYIAVKTDRNELFYGSGGRAPNDWKGKRTSESEIVLFYNDQVWRASALPVHFDLSKAVIISFEKQKVRFYDFQQMEGCYYERFEH